MWLKIAKFLLYLYPERQRIIRVLCALPQDLFSAAIDAGITPDTDLEQCFATLSQLVIDQKEMTLARDFFYRYQKPGEDNEEYARNLQSLAERAFRGTPPNKVANWIAVQFREGVRPPTMVRKLSGIKANSLGQLVNFATKMRQELVTVPRYYSSNRRSNPAPSCRTPSWSAPRSGEASLSLFSLLSNGLHSFFQALDKLWRPCSFLFDLGTSRSAINLEAFLTLSHD